MNTLLKENRKTLTLALPLIAGQVSQMLLGLTDTLMIGRVGTVDLAAAAFANALLYLPLAIGIGLAIAVSIQVAHSHGKGSAVAAGETLRNGFFISLVLGVLLTALIFLSVPFLGLLGQPSEVIAIVPPYLYWLGLSFLAVVPTMVIKGFAEAQSQPWTVLWIQLGGVALNVVLNTIFIFGYLGFPAMGLTGAGMATCIARFATLVVLWYYLVGSRSLSASLPTVWLKRLDRAECRALVFLGSPVGGQLLIEMGAFAFGALMIGRFGAIPLAAHQIAITCAATTFMLPLGLAMAVTIRVGHAISAGEIARGRTLVIGAQLIGLLLMLMCATGYVLFGEQIAASFTTDLEVISLTISILVVVAIFQLFDGIQVISSAALRGMRDVNFPTLILFVCFWLLAIPLGAGLGFTAGLGAIGVWIGLACALGLAAVALSVRVWFKFKVV
ncbi:MATE family efflux transporter [Coraliomargarita sp. W4R53]